MESEHYTIPGYQECVEQAAERLRQEIHRLQAAHRSAGEHGLPPEHLESMLAWRRSLLFALAPNATDGG